MQSKTIEGKVYRCEKVPVMKQLKLLPLMAPLMDEETNDLDVDFEGLFKILARDSKLECETIQVGEIELDGELFPHMDTHFDSIEELMEVMTWCMGCSFQKKEPKTKKKGK